jgi:hypothetical protein
MTAAIYARKSTDDVPPTWRQVVGSGRRWAGPVVDSNLCCITISHGWTAAASDKVLKGSRWLRADTQARGALPIRGISP